MSSFKTIASLAALAAASAAAVIIAGKKKNTAAPEEKTEETAAAAPAEIKKLDTGVYSFIAGYTSTLTSEVKINYDAEKYSFNVVEDESLNDTNVSHVAIMNGEKLDVQLEYSEFYPGEGFENLKASAAERYADCEEVVFGENCFLKYTDGDCICLALPVSGSEECFLLVSIFKAKDNDDKLSDILNYADVKAMLASVTTETIG